MIQRLTARSRNDERGFFTLWVLGLCVVVIFLGGITFDLWNGFSARRQLAATVDGAAVAGASGVDLNAFKTGSGPIQLDPVAVQQRVDQYLLNAEQTSGIELSAPPEVQVEGARVIVTAQSRFSFSLIKVIYPAKDIDISVTGAADAVEAG